MRRGHGIVAVVLVGALMATGCTDDDAADAVRIDVDGAAEAAFTVRGSTGQVVVEDAPPGVELSLIDGESTVVEAQFAPDGAIGTEGVVDEEGNLNFGRIAAGSDYRVAGEVDGEPVASDPVDVGALDDVPDDAFFAGQTLTEGFQYIETRDGTLLSAMVRFPADPPPGTPEDGPYPTVIEMSGYDPSNPDSPEPATTVVDLVGYATVGVNLRGSACSGGSLSFFEDAQVADGYDVIETVAAQDWVLDNEVGMVGLSYPGITQLFMAQTQPPSLAAIAPLSVIADPYRGTLYPGGMLNDGFATLWSEEVSDKAEPGGYDWVADRIAEGDETCAQNQRLRSQNLDLAAVAQRTPFVTAERYDPLAPYSFADRIDVPTFLAGQWQDDQTGGHFPVMIEQFADNPLARFTLANGPHVDGFSAQVAHRWLEFLDFYVAKRIPELPPALRALAPVVLAEIFGAPTPVPEDRFTEFDDYDEALEAYENEARIRVLFEDGGGGPDPGAPVARFDASFEQWPPADAEARTLYFGPDGALSEAEPTEADGDDDAAVSYEHDPAQSQEVTLPGDRAAESASARPDYVWEPPEEGRAVSFVSEPLADDLVIVGPSRADVFLRSTAEDTDLEVTVSEVRPDGKEVYVQSGWLRASHRALDQERSTEFQPIATHLEDDAAPLPPDEYSLVSVEVFPVAHVFRAGSSVRVTVDTPGASRPRWTFDTVDAEGETNTVAVSADHPSRITFPEVDVEGVPKELPPCPGLRGQPCREYVR